MILCISSCPKNERSFGKTWNVMVKNGILDNTAPYMHWVGFKAHCPQIIEYCRMLFLSSDEKARIESISHIVGHIDEPLD